MATLKFSKVLDTLPSTLEADTVYLVKTGSSVKIYVSDSEGVAALPASGSEDGIDSFLLMGVTEHV